jgi:hypothetical protein
MPFVRFALFGHDRMASVVLDSRAKTSIVWAHTFSAVTMVSHKNVLRGWSITPRILDLCTRRRWVVSFTSRKLYPRGRSPEAGRAPQPVWTRWTWKNFQPPPGIEPPNPSRLARKPVANPTELSRLSRQWYSDEMSRIKHISSWDYSFITNVFLFIYSW